MKKVTTLLVVLCLFQTFFSCSNNDDINSNQFELIGTWELIKLEDSQNGIHLPPNDGKPIQITFNKEGAYEGVAGNNQIHGEYRLNGNIIIMTLYTTEILNTELELMFMNAINQTSSQNEYRFPFAVEATKLVFQYQEQSKILFKKI